MVGWHGLKGFVEFKKTEADNPYGRQAKWTGDGRTISLADLVTQGFRCSKMSPIVKSAPAVKRS